MEGGIAAATGISFGAVYNIPRMLMPNISGWSLTDLRNPILVDVEMFEAEPCYRISGTGHDGDPTEIWISKKDYLVRNLRTRSTFKDSHFSTVSNEIHRNIRINHQIADEKFNFKPGIALSKPKEPPEGGILFAPESPTWIEFTSDEGRFKLLMPGVPDEQISSLKTAKGKIVFHSFAASKGGVTCVIDYADIPEDGTDLNPGALFDTARDEFIRQFAAKPASEQQIFLQGYPGREVKFYIHKGQAAARFYLVDRRFYKLTMIDRNLTAKSSSDIDKFFDSFKVKTQTKTIAAVN